MSYKNFDQANDVANLVSQVNEVVAITGSIFSNDLNVKFYKNIASGSAAYDLGGYFETVYDASPTSSLSTALFDVTYGYTTASSYYVSTTSTSSLTEKVKIYRQFAAALLGNPDSKFNIGSTDRNEAFFVSIRRGLQKDELKKGAVSITVKASGAAALTTPNVKYSASDDGAYSAFKQTVGGDYAPLKFNGSGSEVGQVWYNAGVIVLLPNIAFGTQELWSGSVSLVNAQSSGTINSLVDGFRSHVERVDFHNQTNLHSTVFFIRAFNNEFNYSSNPTYVDDNKRIRVTSGSNVLQPRSYITTVGLYDEDDNLIGVAKVNKPITKTFDNEAVLRVRLDY